MIVVDTSVFVAIIDDEPDADDFLVRLSADDDLCIPASCYLEAVMVLRRLKDGRASVDGFIEKHSIAILPCDAAQARLAADAFERYGRGSGHPAKLNFGDCLSYAAARAKGAPLLFKGEDFVHTDLARAA